MFFGSVLVWIYSLHQNVLNYEPLLMKHYLTVIKTNIALIVTYPNSFKPVNFIIEKNFSIGYINITVVSIIKKVP